MSCPRYKAKQTVHVKVLVLFKGMWCVLYAVLWQAGMHKAQERVMFKKNVTKECARACVQVVCWHKGQVKCVYGVCAVCGVRAAASSAQGKAKKEEAAK